MKSIRKPLSVLLIAIMLLSMFTIIPASVSASDSEEAWITYLDENGNEKRITAFLLHGNEYQLALDFYVVGEVNFGDIRPLVSGPTRLILCDGAKLIMPKGMDVYCNRYLKIYAQSTGESAGELIINDVDDQKPGIGIIANPDPTAYVTWINTDNIIINGGRLNVTGGRWAAGIGAVDGMYGGVVINGGSVHATGGDYGAGIGGKSYHALTTLDATHPGDQIQSFYVTEVTINGGSVKATGGICGAGIGGDYSFPGAVTINGGDVTATGGMCAAGIGSGAWANYPDPAYNAIHGGLISITGGSVTATGGAGGGAAIGTGLGSDLYRSTTLKESTTYADYLVTITGGKVNAVGDGYGAGIGGGADNAASVCISGGEVNASSIGGVLADDEVDLSDCGIVTLTYPDEEIPSVSITSSGYAGEITLAKDFSNGTEILSAGTVSDTALIAGKTLTAPHNVHTIGGFDWNFEDNYNPTATALCAYGEPLDVEVTVSYETLPPTRTDDGAVRYVATATYDGNTYTGYYVVRTIPKKSETAETAYLDADGTEQAVTAQRYFGDEDTLSGWYIFDEDVTIDKRLVVSDDAKIILGDNVTVNLTKGVSINRPSDHIYSEATGDEADEIPSLEFYWQSGKSGRLSAKSEANNAAIGSDDGLFSGRIIINGGIITVEADPYGAGIGGGRNGGGSVMINNGAVVVRSQGAESAGIGGGSGGIGTVNINGGSVLVSAIDSLGGGIGGGYNAQNNSIVVLNYTDTVSVTSVSYGGQVKLSKPFCCGADTLEAKLYTDVSDLAGKTLLAYHDHDVSDITWLWTDDLSSAAAVISCKYGEAITVDAVITERRVEPTAYDDGNVEKIATVALSGKEYTDTQKTEVIPHTAEAVEVAYIDADGSSRTADAMAYGGDALRLPSGWYYFEGDIAIDSRLYIDGDVNIILCDHANIKIPKGVAVNSPSSLTIYGQNIGSGKLTVTSPDMSCAGIGSDGFKDAGLITINGGTLDVTSGNSGAGIGSGNGASATVIINRGTVTTVTNNISSAGIGGGNKGSGDVTITGGTVTASGHTGIGGGTYGKGSAKVTITGGTITANSLYEGAAIGSGKNCSGVVVIEGGKITANGYLGPGIGIGKADAGSDVKGAVTISGGTITAESVAYAAAIGCGQHGQCDVTITDGDITAHGGTSGAGIGSSGAGISNISISGGTVNATGKDAPGIGGNGTVTLTYTDHITVTANSYGGAVTLEKDFYNGESRVEAGEVSDMSLINGKTLTPYGDYLLGDVDGDGGITILDATAIQRFLVNLPNATFIQRAADADGDGETTILDATMIQRYLAGFHDGLKIGKSISMGDD